MNSNIFLIIVNCIEEKLSGSSEYKIETPNSTMAVRGTTFRVQIETGEDGEVYAAVSVFEGNVASKLIYPDGSVEEKEVDIATGKAVKILGTGADTMYVTIDDEVDYKELELEVLKFLDKSQENGKELSIPKDDLKEIIEEIISMNKDENKETESTEEETTSYKEEETTTVKQTTTQQTTSQSTTE